MQTQNIRHVANAFICALALSLAFGLVGAPVKAQNAAGETFSFKQLTTEERAKLQAIIAEPVPKDINEILLDELLYKRVATAKMLGDEPTLLAVLKEAALRSKLLQFKVQLTETLIRQDNLEQALQARLDVIKTSNGPGIVLQTSQLALDYYRLNRDAEAIATLEKAQTLLRQAPVPRTNVLRAWHLRAKSTIEITKALLAMREGKQELALTSAQQSEMISRQEIENLKNEDEYSRLNAFQTLTRNLGVRINILNALHRPELETVMRDYLRLFQDKTTPPTLYAQALGSVGQVRFEQKEFVQSLALQRQSFNKHLQLNLTEIAPLLTDLRRDISLTLLGQHRYAEALAEFNKLDALAGNDEKLKERVRYPFDRAVVYLHNNKALEAIPLLASSTDAFAKQYGIGLTGRQHFFTAQSSGLQGLALWRVGTSASKAQAYPLLQAAVRDIMAPENSDYLENVGIRKELREMIFSTYIEAAAQTSPADALAALGIADWLRGGLVQEALGDAAVRAAASNASLSDLVRQDQDARNEIKGLRNFLSGETGATSSPLPQIAAQMRERIALLEKTRADVQVKIKAAFPDYERLVRPLPPSIADIQTKLKTDEALVVLQPTLDATYVWAISKDSTGSFKRVNMTTAQISALVKRLRASLDVAGLPENRRPAFDHTASQELYTKLLAPVAAGLAGKTSLIVAAGGVLGQIPFGVLQTADKDSWLIKQAAVTHVPSVAAWLSMRSLPHQSASQPLLAWGDPLFNIALATPVRTEPVEVRGIRKVVLARANTVVDLEKEDPRSALKYANISPLPETRDELVAIAKTLGADPSRDVILGSAATRESVLAQNKNGNLATRRVVAFATHGLMAGDLPNLTQPALAMAGTRDDATNVLAPLLTLEDVLTLKLNADWVVLSACNTAAADGKAEEALSGLARGFFYAGSRSLLVTHWAVDSESAVTLTTETFKNYQSKPTEAKAESLRQAMLTVMNNPATAHPTYWAPYALVGDGSR